MEKGNLWSYMKDSPPYHNLKFLGERGGQDPTRNLFSPYLCSFNPAFKSHDYDRNRS